jgi:hypothetical protein
MIELSSNIVIDKSLDDSFNRMYDKNEDISNINEDLYKIIEWKISDWKIKNGKRKKTEEIYIYVNELPEYLKSYTLENDKYIRIRRKYKIVNDGIKYKELKCKDEIINLKKGYSAMIKTLKLINIKEYIKLIYVDDNKTELDIKSKITISIPNKEDFENYIKLIFQNILDNLVNKLLKQK